MMHGKARDFIYTWQKVFCERFEPRSHFKSRLSLIIRLNVVLNRTVLLLLTVTDVSTTCVVVIFRVKVSCITSVDGIILWLLIWLVNYFVMSLVVCQLSRDQSVDYCPKQDDHKATSLVTENKQNRSRSTNHKWQTMTFWTRASKYKFSKRSAKMIEGTQKPKICKMHSGIQQISL